MPPGWPAGLNGCGQATSYKLDQAFAVPSAVSGASLSFYLKVLSDETTPNKVYDALKVQVISGGVTTTLATYSNSTSPPATCRSNWT